MHVGSATAESSSLSWYIGLVGRKRHVFYKECVTLLIAACVQLTDENLNLVFTHCIISLYN